MMARNARVNLALFTQGLSSWPDLLRPAGDPDFSRLISSICAPAAANVARLLHDHPAGGAPHDGYRRASRANCDRSAIAMRGARFRAANSPSALCARKRKEDSVAKTADDCTPLPPHGLIIATV
jgi:hypothetical protein